MVYSGLSDDIGTVSQFTRLRYIHVTTNGSSTPANYQVKLTITHEPEMQADFSDIRFNTLGNVYIDYWIESKTDSVTATVWVKLPNAITDPGSDSIWMYYGNDGLSDGGDGDDTFILFDDFEYIDSIANHGWTIESGSPVTSTTQAKWGTRSLETIGNPTERVNRALSGAQIIEFSFYDIGTSDENVHLFYFADTLNAVIGVNGYGALSDTEYIFYKGGSTTNFGTRTIGWHDVKVVFDGTKFNMWFDGTLRYVDGTYPLTKIRIVGDIDGSHFTDGVRTRKYIANEPTPSYGTAQHQRRVPQFIN